MAEQTPRYIQIEDRKAVRDMHTKAILNQDVSARNAYMRRRNMRRRRVHEIANLRTQAEVQSLEISELREQLAELSKLVAKKTTTRKKTTKKAE